jgi:hypothetical protein
LRAVLYLNFLPGPCMRGKFSGLIDQSSTLECKTG